MKNCPFCRKSISENQDSCPYCYRILVERIKPKVITASPVKKTISLSSFAFRVKNYLGLINKRLIYRNSNLKKYFPAIILILFVVFIFIIGDKDNKQTSNFKPVSVIPANTEAVNQLKTNIENVKDPKDYYSLGNGAELTRNRAYFNGHGELEIDNGTSLDAIAKLVNINTNKSILTVYVKAKSIYNITSLSDGNYKLFFNLGNDWDDKLKAFLINSSYEVFEDKFDYVTTARQYTVFQVTLNPVVNGQAQTDEVNPSEFGSY